MKTKNFNGVNSEVAAAKNVTFKVHGERFEMEIARDWSITNPEEITKNIKGVRELVSGTTCSMCSIDNVMGCVGNPTGSRMCIYNDFGGKERVWLIKDNERGYRIDYFKNVWDSHVTSEYVGKKMTDKVIAAYLWTIVEMASRAIFVPASVVLCVKDNVRVNTFDNFVDARNFMEEKFNAYEMEYPNYNWVRENGFVCRVPLENTYMIKMALTTESF